MSYNLIQAVKQLLIDHPESRGSYNRLVMSYWIRVDGYPYTQKDFDQLTPLESICREARKIFADHPELSPDCNPLLRPYHQELFQMVESHFPGSTHAPRP